MEVGTFPESSMDPFCSQQLWDPFPQDSRLPRSVNKLSRSVEPTCVTDLVMDFFHKTRGNIRCYSSLRRLSKDSTFLSFMRHLGNP